MELKYTSPMNLGALHRSNRTFMELKLVILFLHVNTIYRSNRTFMELKLTLVIYKTITQHVLIVPLWN